MSNLQAMWLGIFAAISHMIAFAIFAKKMLKDFENRKWINLINVRLRITKSSKGIVTITSDENGTIIGQVKFEEVEDD